MPQGPLWALIPLYLAGTALASTPQQIPFQTATLDPLDGGADAGRQGHERVVRYSWNSSAQVQEALAALEGLDSVDIWHQHHRSLELSLSCSASEQHVTHLLSTGELPRINTIIDSLPELQRTTPSLFAPYNLLHSSAALSNLSSLRTATLDDSIHKSYHPYEGIGTILRQMEEEFPGFAKVVSFGNSSEGREILGIRITNEGQVHPHTTEEKEEKEEEEGLRSQKHKKKGKKGKKGKKALPHKLGFVVVGASHAREWIAPATILYLSHRLLLSTLPIPQSHHSSHHAASDSDDPRLLNIFTFTFIPVLNVDGYAFSWEHDRLWRKNRQSVGGKDCVGIDLGRNWGFKWSAGQRPNVCSAAYPGREPFEAPELRALSKYLTDPKNFAEAFLDLHSFGSQIQFPYSYSCEKSSADEEDHYEAAVGASKSLKQVHGRAFEVGSACSIALTAPGSSIDWTYSSARIKWSFLMELRDYLWGFLLPPSQIVPSSEELFAALVSLAEFVEKKERGGR